MATKCFSDIERRNRSFPVTTSSGTSRTLENVTDRSSGYVHFSTCCFSHLHTLWHGVDGAWSVARQTLDFAYEAECATVAYGMIKHTSRYSAWSRNLRSKYEVFSFIIPRLLTKVMTSGIIASLSCSTAHRAECQYALARSRNHDRVAASSRLSHELCLPALDPPTSMSLSIGRRQESCDIPYVQGNQWQVCIFQDQIILLTTATKQEHLSNHHASPPTCLRVTRSTCRASLRPCILHAIPLEPSNLMWTVGVSHTSFVNDDALIPRHILPHHCDSTAFRYSRPQLARMRSLA